MAVSLKHTTQATGTDAGNGEIRKAQWNEEHTLTAAANTLLGAVSAGAVGEITCTAAGRALLDDADAAAQRTTLGLGSIATQAASNVAVTGGTINGTSIGATTAAAGKFTTLDISSQIAQSIVAVSALDIDCSAGNYFTKTINANSTFTFSNAPASRAFSFTLELTHTSGTVTWPTAVKWPGDTTPSLTTGKTHLFIFVTDDGGTRWRGSSLVNYTN